MQVQQARVSLRRLLAEAEAPSTRTQRDALEARWRHWCRANGVEASEDSIPLYVVAKKGLKASSCLQYLSALKARIRPQGTLDLAAKGLRRRMAREDLQQATPLPPDMVIPLWKMLRRLSEGAAAGFLLAWRTASRIDDLVMPVDGILRAHIDEIIVDFGPNTKSSQVAPFQPQLLVHVLPGQREKSTLPWRSMVQYLQKIRTLEHGIILNQSDRRLVLRALDEVGPAFTGHSIKRGALNVVAEKMAAESRPKPHLLSLLAKHKVEGGPLGIAESTLRYVTNRVAVARLLGTGGVTPWLAPFPD